MEKCKIYSDLKKISADLSARCSALRFSPPVTAVYNPLEYAILPHEKYLKLATACDKPKATKKVIFLGMNPGPWGMTQTGVPFGEIAAVRDWLGIEAAVSKPKAAQKWSEHPKRPIEGFNCKKSEVSGRRLWGLFRERFGSPENFFRDHYVANYCPLVFMSESGKNITPDQLPKTESAPLYKLCDEALVETIKVLRPEWVIGIGGFAKKKIDGVQKEYFLPVMEGGIGKANTYGFRAAQILHPSPASPKANAGWEREVIKTLVELGVWQ